MKSKISRSHEIKDFAGVAFHGNATELRHRSQHSRNNEKIENLPPSAKLVFKVLEYSGLLTQKEIAQETYLPARTVRYALNRLKKEKILEERFCFKDARQSLYGLKSPSSSAHIEGMIKGVLADT